MATKPVADDGAQARRPGQKLTPPPETPEEKLPWYRCLGPGLITGAADDDPSGIGTYSATGAQSGYLLLWLVPWCIPMMIAVQEMCGRLGAVTGMGLAAILKKHYPPWLLYSCVALLVGANVFNVYADLNVMAASCQMLFHTPFLLNLTIIAAVLVAGLILLPYCTYAKILKWLCISLVGYVVVALMPEVHNDWAVIGRSLWIPHIKTDKGTILLIVAFLGTTISPYLFFWQAAETVEEEVAHGTLREPGAKRKDRVSDGEIRNIRADTATGMIFSQVVAFFMVVATAGVLFQSGVKDINTAKDAAQALAPLGPVAYWIFTLGIVGTGLLAVPTLAGSAAYAIAETFGWKYGLYRRFDRARGFYLIIAAMVMIGYLMNFSTWFSPVKALVYSAALNGIIAPPLIVVLLLICNNRRVVGERKNGPWSNGVGWATVAFMTPAAVYLVYSTIFG